MDEFPLQSLDRRNFLVLLARAGLGGAAALALLARPASAEPAQVVAGFSRFVIDMVSPNPGEPPPQSRFRDPAYLAAWNYNGQVAIGQAGGIATFRTLDPDLVPVGGRESDWAEQKARVIDEQITAAHAAGIKAYIDIDLLIFPVAVMDAFRPDLCDEKGRIDIHKPLTQVLLRIQMRETFARLPALDGVIVRTGEIYLYDYPFHTAGGSDPHALRQSNTAIIDGTKSHTDLLSVLRDEVCVRLGKSLFYRTWDFGFFHTNPTYYLTVTNAIEPHPNLTFSIKHQAGDFHQLTPFNPTLMIGAHRQIVEVQCQREAYGKGAHPYYVGAGVINGWEEYAWMMKPDQPKGLRDIVHNRLFSGVWTWSRGGGWEGPYIPNEIWCALNAYVVSRYAEDPSRSEARIFEDFAQMLGLSRQDIRKFRELNLLSARAVLRGQLTTLGANIYLWWTRDDFIGEPDLSDVFRKGLAERAIAEKAEAVNMWRRIVDLANEIDLPDHPTRDYIRISALYGLMKYSVIAAGWTVLLCAQNPATKTKPDHERIAAAIGDYDRSWAEWRALKQSRPLCPTLYKDKGFGDGPGIGAAIDRYRELPT